LQLGTDNGPSLRTVGHVVPEYLPRSATFIYTTLRFQHAFGAAVFARRTSNLEEFPIDSVSELDGDGGAWTRAGGTVRARAAGYRERFDHRIASEAARRQCVALHAHFGWAGRSSVDAAARLGIPLLTTFYGRDLSEVERTRGGMARNPYRRLFSTGTLFVCEGPAMAKQLARVGCPKERIRIVRIGLDLAKFPLRPRRRARPLILLQTCRFVDKKGVDLSIRAFAAARARLGPSELWLVGDGPLRHELEALASELGLTDSVRFLGMVSHDEYRQVIERAHVCLQPSRTAGDGDTEGGAPTVLLEMQASGVPVLATRHADIPFVVGRPDELVDEDDAAALSAALVRLVEAPEADWDARIEAGRQLVEREHDGEVVARALASVYEEAIELAAAPSRRARPERAACATSS
jgi:colanic acid/amylovoran biosynthesis glycosyltransferase